MLLLASFLTAHFGQWRQSWHDTNPVRAGQPLLGAEERYEGALALLDWDRRSICWSRSFDTPSGICFADENLYLASMLGNRLYVLGSRLQVESTLSVPQFNDVHTVVMSSRGLLITSSGIDGIIEVSLDGRLLWHWLATEHGYDRTPAGYLRRVSLREDGRRRDHRTPEQTTHCNSAVFTGPDEGAVLATLFHQGQLIRIERRTGRHEVLVSGMTRAHAVRPAPWGGWTCCDSQNGSVVVLTPDFRIQNVIEGGFDWTQDALPTPARTLLVADANHHRVVEVDLEGAVVADLVVPEEWKFFQIESVPAAWEARLLAVGARREAS